MGQKDLFGNDVKVAKLLNEKTFDRKSVIAHRLLLQLHGESSGKKCGKCRFFYFRCFSKKYPKCSKSGLTGSTVNHDWSSRWKACGLFEITIGE